MARLRRHKRSLVQRDELLRGRDRCRSTHPMWGSVRCERMDSDHVTHHADGRTFEWVQFMPIFARTYEGRP